MAVAANDVLGDLLEGASANRNRTLNSTIDANLRAATGEALALVRYDVRAIAKAVAADACKQLALLLNDFADALGIAVRNRPGRITEVFQKAGEAGQQAVVEAYIAQHGRSISYRWEDSGRYRRFSNKVLLEALRSPQLFHAAPDGLAFISGSFLDSKAKQWYRLNFGAAPRGSEAPAVTRMEFASGSSLPGLKLEGGPSSAFSLPPGFWSGDAHPSTPSTGLSITHGRGLAFYPGRLVRGGSLLLSRAGEKGRRTKGIEGTRYLDAGVNEINRVLPTLIENLMQEWIVEAQGSASKPPGGKLASSVLNTSNRQLKQLSTRLKTANRALVVK